MSKQTGYSICFIFLLVIVTATPSQAKHLPVRNYTTADNLLSNTIIRIVRDSKGFLWLCTLDGLSRFDGYEFTNYGMSKGLPHPVVTHLLEARDGTYWIATNGGGVARLNKPSIHENTIVDQQKTFTIGSSASLFNLYPVGDNPSTNRVNILYQDRAGTIWAGTDGELFRLEKSGEQEVFRKFDLGLPEGHQWVIVLALAEDKEGNLWIGTSDGVFVRRSDGQMRHYSIQPLQDKDWVRSLLLDSEGELWIGHLGSGLIVLDLAQWKTIDQALPKYQNSIQDFKHAIRRWFTKADGLADDEVYALYQSSDKHIWAGTGTGLNEFDGQRFKAYAQTEELEGTSINWLTEDMGGNLWSATNQGAVKVLRNGFSIFRKADGLGDAGVLSIFENRNGELCVVTNDAMVNLFDGQRFKGVRPQIPQNIFLELPQTVLQDRAEEWWFPTLEGLFRFPKVSRFEDLNQLSPKAVYTNRNGLSGNRLMPIYESAQGDIWISVGFVTHNLVRWSRATQTFYTYTEADGVPQSFPASCFVEDRSGTLWIGLKDGGVLRYGHDRFKFFTAADGIPTGQVNKLYVDQMNRLWIATDSGGIGRIDDVTAARLRVVNLTVKDGLTSNNIMCITEDEMGRIYFGTSRGIDRFDPTSGSIIHYTNTDGLNIGSVEIAFRDRHGKLWFGGQRGLVQLVPESDNLQRPPPSVFISGLRIPDASVGLSEPGQTEVTGLELGPNQNQLQIDFVGIGFSSGEILQYEFKLEGAEQNWGTRTNQRSVYYASLAPGTYRFVVRAINGDGAASLTPATVGFTILPPFWRRWWFIALCAFLVCSLGFALYRYRVARLFEMANMRTRIATDLHDDIGANLTRIALLSEVMKHQMDHNVTIEENGSNPLSSIARIARESVSSMSDIVWAINPERDSLLDLTRKMRSHAEEIFTLRDIDLTFNAPDSDRNLKLGVAARRDLLLIFKEAVNNSARHSSCTKVEVDFRVEYGTLYLSIVDNGKGFKLSFDGEGQGLRSMKRRAESLGAKFFIDPKENEGTTILVTLSLTRARSYA